MHQLGLMLAHKLNISLSDDGALPAWFPRVGRPNQRMETEATPAVPEPVAGFQTSSLDEANDTESGLTNGVTSTASDAALMEPWDNDDDVLISEAAENFEHQLRRSADTTTPMIHALASKWLMLHTLIFCLGFDSLFSPS